MIQLRSNFPNFIMKAKKPKKRPAKKDAKHGSQKTPVKKKPQKPKR